MESFDIPSGARAILDALHDHGYEAYVVGGCIRDSLLGLTPHDWDICTSALPHEILTCFAATRVIETGLQHGTVTIVQEDGQYEVTTFRIDGEYSDSRHPDNVQFVTSLKEDLARRDFTVNAMAYDPTVGVIDYFDGEKDLSNGILSCVGSPDTRFGEDSLRILRAMRFASAYEFCIAPDTADSIHLNAHRLRNIAAERINVELCKLLSGKGVLPVLLEYSDVMAVIIPELGPSIGFEQNNRFHEYTVYDHIAHAVSNCPNTNIVVRMALLLHDIGKPMCYTEDSKGGHFFGHALPSHDMAEAALDRLRFDNKRRKEILELVLNHDTPIEPKPRAVRKWLNKLGPEQFLRLLDLKQADISAHAADTQSVRLNQLDKLRQLTVETIEAGSCFSMKDLAINGRDIMSLGVSQSKVVGITLKALLNEVIDGTVPNERTLLMAKAKRILANL